MTCSICNTKRGWRTMVDGQGLLFCLPLPAFLAHILNVSGISLQFEDRVVTLCFGKSRNHFRDAINYILFRTSIDWWRSRDVGTLASSRRRYPRNGSFNLQQGSKSSDHPTHHACQRSLDAIAWQRKQQSHLGKPQALLWISCKSAFPSARRIRSQAKKSQTWWWNQTGFLTVCTKRTWLQRTPSRRFDSRTHGNPSSTFAGQRASGRSGKNEIHSWSLYKYNRINVWCQRPNNTKRLDVCTSMASPRALSKVWNGSVACLENVS